MATKTLDSGDDLLIIRYSKVEAAGGIIKDTKTSISFSYDEVINALLIPKQADDYKALGGSFSRSVGILARNVDRKSDPRGRKIDLEASVRKIKEAFKTLPEPAYHHVSEGVLELLLKINKKHKGVLNAEVEKIIKARG